MFRIILLSGVLAMLAAAGATTLAFMTIKPEVAQQTVPAERYRFDNRRFPPVVDLMQLEQVPCLPRWSALIYLRWIATGAAMFAPLATTQATAA